MREIHKREMTSGKSSSKKPGESFEDREKPLLLRLSGRGGRGDGRQTSKLMKKMRQALWTSKRGSSGGTSGVSRRSKGAMTKTTRSTLSTQRCAVRWGYAKNKGDGQWAAFGKYIERESAGLDQEIEAEIEGRDFDLAEQHDNELTQERTNDERDQRQPGSVEPGQRFVDYSGPSPTLDRRALSALRQPDFAQAPRAAQAQSLNSVRTLSSVGVVRFKGRGQGVLQDDAPGRLVERGASRDQQLRRGSRSESGARSSTGRRSVTQGRGFDGTSDSVSASKTLERWQSAGDQHLHKLIVSPEFGERVDLRQFTRDLVAQMEKDLGTKLQWVAADHYDTDNPHVHLAIRGVDEHGRVLEVNPKYIKEGVRQRAREAVTKQIGYRTERDVAEALERQITQQRFTDIDRSILSITMVDGVPIATKDSLSTGYTKGDKPGQQQSQPGEQASPKKSVLPRDAVKLMEHGQAPYQFDPNNKDSYFARLQMQNGQERVVWGVDIERCLEEGDVGTGDWIKLERGGKVAVHVSEIDPETGKEVTKEAHRIDWDVKKYEAPEEDRSVEIEIDEGPAAGPHRAADAPKSQKKKDPSLGVVSFKGLPVPSDPAQKTQRVNQIRRLGELEKMGLAQKVDELTWKVNPALESALREMQKSQDRLKTMAEHKKMISDPSARLILSEIKAPGDRVTGRLVGTGMNDQTGRPYMLIEGVDGRVHFMDQSPKVQSLRASKELRVGDYITLEAQTHSESGVVYAKVTHHGKAMGVQAVDAELVGKGAEVKAPLNRKTVAGAFLAKAVELQEKLVAAGAVKVVADKLVVASEIKRDVVLFKEEHGVDAAEVDLRSSTQPGQPVLAEVVSKGRGGVIVKTADKKLLAIDSRQLQSVGLDARYLPPGTAVQVLSYETKAGRRLAAVAVQNKALPGLVEQETMNKLDSMMPSRAQASGEIRAALDARADVWAKRGVGVTAETFRRDAAGWVKTAANHKLAMEKGADVVIEELAKERGKPAKELALEPGRQISGRVLLATKNEQGGVVVVDSGRELTVIRQPAGQELDVRAGQRVRAMSEVNQTISRWRFADMERSRFNFGKGF